MKILQTHELPITKISPFGNIDLGVPVNQFFKMGFNPGDAVDVEFSNGFTFHNIPVFSGFYGKGHSPCLYAVSSLYPHIGIGCPVSGNPWALAGIKPSDTARIILRNKRGFDQLEKRMCLPALLHPSPIRTPQQNANWRSLAAGKIAPSTIYRSCSPIRNDVAAAATACILMKDAGIQSVLNLSDTPAILQASKAETNAHTTPYLHLYDKGRVLPLYLGVDLSLQENAHALANGLLWLASQPKPALIHCRLGLDRTGAVCVLLEMLAGCSYEDIKCDYQASYFNLFGLPPNNEQSYPLCNLRFKELLDFLLSFTQETKKRKNHPSTAVSTEEEQGDTLNTTQKHPDSKTLRLAARSYLAFGGLNEKQIDYIEHMFESAHINSKETPQ